MTGDASSNHMDHPEKLTAKRSPSILVTDSRNHISKGVRAPFAGHNYKKEQQLQSQGQNHYSGSLYSFHRLNAPRTNRYTDISVDKLLSNSSDIPSGQRRLPPLLSRRGQSGVKSPNRSLSPNYITTASETNGNSRLNVRSIPKLSRSLPSRTSKTSQKLVLIPDQNRMNTASPPHILPMASGSTLLTDLQILSQRSRAELMSKEARAQELNRVTAYYICEHCDLSAVSNFLKENHGVKPRVYDEALYAPYSLPLLPGADGYRVKSNDSVKLLANNRYMEKLINRSEQADHLYEYYSGVETPEDANNYSMDPEQENDNAPFDPSEPQFFAPPVNRPLETVADVEKLNGSNVSSSDKKDDTSPSRLLEYASADMSSTKDQKNESANVIKHSNDSRIELSKHHAEMFIFNYGIIVFWNFSEIHEKNILADLAFAPDEPSPLLIKPIDEQDIETEEFHFEYDPNIQRPRIYNDMITLRSGDHLIKLTMSHAIAQLTKLCLFESRMLYSLQLISKLPRKLALTGRLGLKRQQLLKKAGKLFKLRVDVNLSSSILDTPDFFWSFEPALNPLYSGVREYLEIDQRVQVLNDRCKVFLEFLDIVSDSMNERNTNRIAWMIIIIIFLNLSVSIFEFFLQFV